MDLHPNQVSLDVVNGSLNTINPFLSEMGIVSAVGVRDTNYPTTSSNSNNHHQQQYNNLAHHLPVSPSSRINNHVEKKSPDHSRTEPRMVMSEVEDEALFGASPLVQVAMVSMFCSLLAALTYAICMYVKVKALAQRLTIYEGHATSAKKTFYPYYARDYNTQPPQQASVVGYGRIVDFVGGHSK